MPLVPSPVKEVALASGLPVCSGDAEDGAALAALRLACAGPAAVVAYGICRGIPSGAGAGRRQRPRLAPAEIPGERAHPVGRIERRQDDGVSCSSWRRAGQSGACSRPGKRRSESMSLRCELSDRLKEMRASSSGDGPAHRGRYRRRRSQDESRAKLYPAAR